MTVGKSKSEVLVVWSCQDLVTAGLGLTGTHEFSYGQPTLTGLGCMDRVWVSFSRTSSISTFGTRIAVVLRFLSVPSPLL